MMNGKKIGDKALVVKVDKSFDFFRSHMNVFPIPG